MGTFRRIPLGIVLAACIACSGTMPDPHACPDLSPPEASLDGDALPDPAACFASQEVRDYIESWRAALLAKWKPPAAHVVLPIVLTIDASGEVERYCFPEARGRHARWSVSEAISAFDPPRAPDEAVAACITHKRLSGVFRAF